MPTTKLKFKCTRRGCGCEQMIAIYENATVHARLEDIRINENGQIEYRVKERAFMIQKPTAYACEACNTRHAFSNADLLNEAQRHDRPTLTPVVEDSDRKYRRAAELLRKKVMEQYEDAVDRGSEREMAELDAFLKAASDAGIQD